MKIFKVQHIDAMGYTIKEEFYDSKNKAKKALKRMFKEIKPNIADERDISDLSSPVIHRKQLHLTGKSKICFDLLFEVWHKCSYKYDEWDTYVERLNIELVKVN